VHEFGNTAYRLSTLFIKHDVHKVNASDIYLLTERYSAFYFPELTHNTLYEYERLYYNQYKLLQEFFCDSSICVLDYGCGIAYIPFLFCEKKIEYLGYDYNNNIISTNKYIFNDVFQSYLPCSMKYDFFSDFSEYNNCTHVILFNVLKHIIYKRSSEVQCILKTAKKILIYDEESTCSSFCDMIKHRNDIEVRVLCKNYVLVRIYE